MHAAKRNGGYTFALVSAQIRVAGISMDPTVVVAHIAGPWPIDGWRRDLDRLRVTLLEVAAQTSGASVIVAGDVNSTTDMRRFHGLLRNGYRDVAVCFGNAVNARSSAPGHSSHEVCNETRQQAWPLERVSMRLAARACPRQRRRRVARTSADCRRPTLPRAASTRA